MAGLAFPSGPCCVSLFHPAPGRLTRPTPPASAVELPLWMIITRHLRRPPAWLPSPRPPSRRRRAGGGSFKGSHPVGARAGGRNAPGGPGRAWPAIRQKTSRKNRCQVTTATGWRRMNSAPHATANINLHPPLFVKLGQWNARAPIAGQDPATGVPQAGGHPPCPAPRRRCAPRPALDGSPATMTMPLTMTAPMETILGLTGIERL